MQPEATMTRKMTSTYFANKYEYGLQFGSACGITSTKITTPNEIRNFQYDINNI